MQSILTLIAAVLEMYKWCIIVAVVLSWLTYGNVINTQNRFVYMVGDFVYRITEPALRIFRRWIPNIGGIDVSPIALILLIWLIQLLIQEYRFAL